MKRNIFSVPDSLELSSKEEWRPFPVFRFITGDFQSMSCHISILRKDSSPHDPHSHEEEEILMLLSGEVILELPNIKHISNSSYVELGEGQFVYYPAHFSHTLKTVSKDPAKYLMLKWKTGLRNNGQKFEYDRFDSVRSNLKSGKGNSFSTIRLLDRPTLYLEKLQCHISSMAPGAGYEPHRDDYDVAVIVMQGELETLGKSVKAGDVIWYSAGEIHNMRNPGEKMARYIVFEFHTRKIALVNKISNLMHLMLVRGVDLKFWKRRIKKLLSIIIKV